MKTIFQIIPAFLITGIMLSGCEYDKETHQQQDSKGRVTGHSECKGLKSSNSSPGISDSLSCIEHSFDETTHKLLLKHINAGFNCCPGDLSCTVLIKNDTITIQEAEQYKFCDCECLYDVDIEINNVEKQIYQIIFIEPYIGTQEPLNFTIDLRNEATGSYCVSRTQYPWALL
ncbi:MAG: hypothetical protein V1775_05330 [Bacteroidota bacterium]